VTNRAGDSNVRAPLLIALPRRNSHSRHVRTFVAQYSRVCRPGRAWISSGRSLLFCAELDQQSLGFGAT
jgi:hypothetical protein